MNDNALLKMYQRNFREFLWENKRETYTYIMLGHTELITKELIAEFKEWLIHRNGGEL